VHSLFGTPLQDIAYQKHFPVLEAIHVDLE